MKNAPLIVNLEEHLYFMKVPFNIPLVLGTEVEFVEDAIHRREFSGGSYYTIQCEEKLESFCQSSKVLLTSSCTHALEMSALLIDIEEGDEVIMSSYNFVSCANAFSNFGAKIKFVDIDPFSMNIDPSKIEEAITERTKAIVLMHYGSIPCELEQTLQLAKSKNIFVIEDAAHCIGATNNGQHLGTFGDLGTLSFHATKNIHCGEGGALLINNPSLIQKAEEIREKGTNRKSFQRGEIKKYTWVNKGSSYLTSELSAAYLFAQLQEIEKVNAARKKIFDFYHSELSNHFDSKDVISNNAEGNGHIFYFKHQERDLLSNKLKSEGISAYFHYVPLHSSPYGVRSSTFIGTDLYTSSEAEKLLRLPLYYGLDPQQVVDTLVKVL